MPSIKKPIQRLIQFLIVNFCLLNNKDILESKMHLNKVMEIIITKEV